MRGSLVGIARIIAAENPCPSEDLLQHLLAYPGAVRDRLRGILKFRPEGMENRNITKYLLDAHNVPFALGRLVAASFRKMAKDSKISERCMHMLDLHLGTLTDAQIGMERISTTEIPPAYSKHISQLLTVFLISINFFAYSTYKLYTPVVLAIVAFGLLGIETAGKEIEMPFGDDANDIPVDAIVNMINRDLRLVSVSNVESIV
eukprot:ANDGO_03450.mRNA.1 UPF0187 protein sll1024